MPEFELVLPCYNEAHSLEALINRAVCSAKEAGFTEGGFQLVLVENGSRDNSLAVMERLKRTPLGKWFIIVRVRENQGYGHGLFTGLKATTAPYVGWSHADQQCDPADAFKCLSQLKREPARVIVKGERRGRNWKDVLVSRTFELMARILLQVPLTEINAQPKVFPRALLDEITNPPSTFAFDLYVLYRALKSNYQIRTIPVFFPPRIHGVSNWAANIGSRYRTILGMIRYVRQLASEEK